MSGFTEVFAWGGDHFGQLGQGTPSQGKTYTLPRLCSFSTLIRELACGDEHTAFVDFQGYVYTMGSNSEGRLGVTDRSVKQSASPCLVEGITRVVTLDCGWGHTAAVTEDGGIYTWGMGEHGQLGLGSTESQWKPMRVGVDARVKAASCGARHTAFIAADAYGARSLHMCGSGEAGQLGTGRRDKELRPVRVNLGEEIKQVSCGIFHTGFVTHQGKLYMTGGNSFGQLGLGTRKSTHTPQRLSYFSGLAVAKVACGQHTAAVTEGGELYIWGTGVFGEYLSPQKQSISSSIRDVSVGGGFGAALDVNKKLWVWGSNDNGELGLGDYTARDTPALLTHLSARRVRLIACGGCSAIALGSDVAENYRRDQSPHTARPSSRSPYSSQSKSPLRSERPLTSERSYRSPLSHSPLELSQLQNESFDRLPSKYKRDDSSTNRVDIYLARIQELEDLLKHKDIEVANAKSQIDRVSLSSDENVRNLNGGMQILMRQNQSMAGENQRLKQEMETMEAEMMYVKTSHAALIGNNERLTRELEGTQKVLEDLQRRTDSESRLKDSSLNSQLARLRDSYESQLLSLQTRLDEETLLTKQLKQDRDLATAHITRLEHSLNTHQTQIDAFNQEKTNYEQQFHIIQQQKDEIQHLQSELKSKIMLENAVSELNYQLESLRRLNNEQNNEIDDLRQNLSDKSEEIDRLQRENIALTESLSTAELKNRELFANFERELTTRARDYREKAIYVLGSPKSPQNASPKPASGLKSERYRGSPGLNLSVMSEKGQAGALSTRRGVVDSSRSPDVSMRVGGRQSPPTFREARLNLTPGGKSSITEIREKLASLQQNKSLLEAKMRDFERKIRPNDLSE